VPSNKERAINVRIDDKEYKQIADKAKALNMKLSEYIRFVALNAEITVKVGGREE
jgi:antitoxin component of RelBE/YafQ-DinJ toxin-antitoxin module